MKRVRRCAIHVRKMTESQKKRAELHYIIALLKANTKPKEEFTYDR